MNGWLSPTGKFYPCGINEHINKAKELFFSKNPERSLEKLKWLKIVPDCIFIGTFNEFIDENTKDDLTQAQLNFLEKLTHNKNASFSLREFANYMLTGSYKITN